MGGFIGAITYYAGAEDFAILENCWSQGPVKSRGANSQYTGGLIGSYRNADGNNIIRKCFSSGAVTAVNSSSIGGDFCTGGLAEEASGTSIEESWASGRKYRRIDNSRLLVKVKRSGF